MWGSAYYTEHPTVPLKNIIADLNIDMIGRTRGADDKNPRNAVLSGANEIYVVGASKLSTQLGEAVKQVNGGLYGLSLNYKYDDPKDKEQIYYRSDHFNYASKGVPIAFFFDGVHEDYHRVTDDVEKIDFPKMEKVVRTVHGLAWKLADGKNRPVVDGK